MKTLEDFKDYSLLIPGSVGGLLIVLAFIAPTYGVALGMVATGAALSLAGLAAHCVAAFIMARRQCQPSPYRTARDAREAVANTNRRAGRQAFAYGAEIDANPHPEHSSNAKEWADGWRQGDEARTQAFQNLARAGRSVADPYQRD